MFVPARHVSRIPSRSARVLGPQADAGSLMLRLRLIGGLALEVDGAEVSAPESRRARALLAWLALNPGVHARSKVAGTFWPDVMEVSARASLRVALTEARRALGPTANQYLVATRDEVGLADDGSVWVDLWEFRRFAEGGRLAEAVELASGELLAGLDEQWVYDARERHLDDLSDVLERLAGAAEERGDLRAAVAWSRRRAELTPLSEGAAQALMRRLVAGGDRAAALATYERLRERLRSSMGIAPSPESRALAEGLRGGSHVGSGASAVADVAANVPVEGTPLTVLTAELETSGVTRSDGAPAPEALVRVLVDVAQRGSGQVEQTATGLVATFASASNAAESAASMQRALERAARRPAQRGVSLRVGLVAGDMGDEGRSADGPGALAAELCQRAEAGQILLSDLVRRLVGPQWEGSFRELGRVEVDGLAGPLAVSELLWRRPDVSRLELPPALAAEDERPFVGRANCLGRLRAGLDRTRGGRGQLVLLSGEPGIGKTRLAARLATHAHGDGFAVLFGRCFEQAAAPYQPFVEALAPYLHRLGPARLEEQLGVHEEALARVFPDLATARRPPAATTDREADRLALFAAITALVASAARPHGLVLILEDLHWADAPTRTMLQHLLRSLPQMRVLLVGTYRESELEREGPFAEMLGDAARDPGFEPISLGPLEEADVASLLSAFGSDPCGNGMSAALHAHTEGNPFFIVELLRHLRETGLSGAESPLADDLIAKAGVPERVKLVIARRLSRLPGPTQRLLSLAAVVGREFDFDLLEEISELSGEELADALDEAAAAGIIDEDTQRQGRYRFAHSLIRETLYEQVSRTRRALLHRRVGEALERVHSAARDIYSGPLAYHFCEAATPRDFEKAVAYVMLAGEAAITKLAFEEAAAHYESGLSVLDRAEPGDDERRCDLLLALGDAQVSVAEVETWRSTFLQAAQLAEGLGSPDRLARAAVGFGGRYAAVEVGVVNEEVVELLEKAEAALDRDDGALRAEVMARLAEALAFAAGAAERRETLATDAVAMARRVAEPLALARVLSRVVWACWGPDNLEQRLSMTREFTALAHAEGDRRLAAQGHSWLHTHQLERGDIDAARAEMEWHQSESGRLGDAWRTWISAVYRANQALFDGRLDVVEDLAAEALRVGQAAQNVNATPMFGAQLLLLRREQGRLEEVVPALEQFADQMPLVPSWHGSLAHAYAELGREDDARAELERFGSSGFAEIPRDVLWLSSMYGFAEAAAHVRSPDQTKCLYDLLLPYADRCGVIVVGAYLGPVARLLGRLAATCGRNADARVHFEHALQIAERAGSPLSLAQTRCDYAQALLEAGGAGTGRGRELVEQALEEAQRRALPALVARATSVLDAG